MTSYVTGDLVEAIQDIPLHDGGVIENGTPGVVARDSADGIVAVSVSFEGDSSSYRNVAKSTIRRRVGATSHKAGRRPRRKRR